MKILFFSVLILVPLLTFSGWGYVFRFPLSLALSLALTIPLIFLAGPRNFDLRMPLILSAICYSVIHLFLTDSGDAPTQWLGFEALYAKVTFRNIPEKFFSEEVTRALGKVYTYGMTVWRLGHGVLLIYLYRLPKVT